MFFSKKSVCLSAFALFSLARAAPTPSEEEDIFEDAISKGYVAFGDSYAAGIGTGQTEGDGCRKGSYSYPRQLARGLDIDFQNYPCSGAVVTEILEGYDKSQIDKWTNPSNADMATLSIGGNDIGFYDVLTSCVLRVGQYFAGDCDKYVNKAYNIINGPDLYNDVGGALQQILEKSNRDDFRIYLTGYPQFFNAETDYCDFVTFYYWQPDHHGIHRPGNWQYLYKSHRARLNELVKALNKMLSQVVDSVNESYPNRVTFVDVDSYFKGHRFCEEGVKEPDSEREDTWLFLSGWNDNSLPDTETAKDSINAEINAQWEGNSTALPDPDCEYDSKDWYDTMLCEMSKAVYLTPQGDYDGPNEAWDVVIADQDAIDGGDFNAVEVPWYIPTRTAKTFHPKTLGQLAYKQAVLDAVAAAEQDIGDLKG